MVSVRVTRAVMRVESSINSTSVTNKSERIWNANKGMGFWSTPDCVRSLTFQAVKCTQLTKYPEQQFFFKKELSTKGVSIKN